MPLLRPTIPKTRHSVNQTPLQFSPKSNYVSKEPQTLIRRSVICLRAVNDAGTHYYQMVNGVVVLTFLVHRIVVVAAVSSLLAGCGASFPAGDTSGLEQTTSRERNLRLGGTSEGNSLKDLVLGDRNASENALPVNKYLWRASLDTLSFLPLASTDPFSGVISTEWGASPDAPNERVRVTAYVEGKELTARALDVSVFREMLNGSGAWVAAPVNPETAGQVKDKILMRARELRIADVDGPGA